MCVTSSTVLQPPDCSSLAADLRSSYPGVRDAAALKLGRLGPAAACAVDPLRGLVRDYPDDPEGADAIVALGRIGPAAISAAPDLMNSALQPKAARDALDALARLGPGVIPFLLPWLELTPNEFGDLEGNAGLAQIVFSQVGRPAVHALTGALNIPKRRVGAADALATIGPEASPAVAALVRTYDRDKSPAVRYAILKALGKIGPGARRAKSLLERVVRSEQDRELNQAARDALVKVSGAQQ